MKFEVPFQQAIFQKRYKRFFADVMLGDKVEVAHVPNTGSLKSVAVANQPCLVSASTNPERKLKWTLQAIRAESGAWVGVNTAWPNVLLKEIFEKQLFPHWKEFSLFKPEVKITAETRLDALLSSSDGKKKHYVEVKNVTLADGDLTQKKGRALFPDAVTVRGQKHLQELEILAKTKNVSAEIVFLIQRDDCNSFAAAQDIDPDYARLLEQVKKSGVQITPAVFSFSDSSLQFSKILDF